MGPWGQVHLEQTQKSCASSCSGSYFRPELGLGTWELWLEPFELSDFFEPHLSQ